MYGTIQLSEVLFNAHISSLTKAQASLAGVSKPNFNTTSESKVLDLYQEQFNELYQLMTSLDVRYRKRIGPYRYCIGTNNVFWLAVGRFYELQDKI